MHRRLTYSEWQLYRPCRGWFAAGMMIAGPSPHQLECAVTIVATVPVTMQRRLHRQLLQSLRRRHGRFETGQATPPRSGPVRFGGPERRQPLPAYLALVVYRCQWPVTVWPPPALLPHAAEFRLPGPLMPDATLLVHTLALPSSRAQLIHMRTFQSCGLY
jgi:hypothetical protein